MKVALVHDYIKEYGGAERVLEALHEVWPKAPVYTTVYLPEFLGPHRDRFKGWDIRTSFLQYIPFKAKLISPFRYIAPLVFRTFDFSNFDIVVVSQTGAYTPNMIRSTKRPIHICYTHTPPRYLYGYPTAREWRKNTIVRVIGEIGNHVLRLVDFQSAQNVDYFIANSKNVAARIKKFYRREAKVIYPPVDAARGPAAGFPPASARPPAGGLCAVGSPSTRVTPRSYYLTGGRLARPKHIDLIVRACVKLKVPLKIFGREFAGAPNILVSQYPNIQFLGEVTDDEKFELMRGAKAFIFASEEEDFGITPVEAMAAGTPVVAYRSGGVLESVIEGKTGVFFNELTVGSLLLAIKHFNDIYHLSMRKECVKRAAKFSKERFKKKIVQFIASQVKLKVA